jgi:hypothetical protein
MPPLYGRNSSATNFDLLRYRIAREANHGTDTVNSQTSSITGRWAAVRRASWIKRPRIVKHVHAHRFDCNCQKQKVSSKP